MSWPSCPDLCGETGPFNLKSSSGGRSSFWNLLVLHLGLSHCSLLTLVISQCPQQGKVICPRGAWHQRVPSRVPHLCLLLDFPFCCHQWDILALPRNQTGSLFSTLTAMGQNPGWLSFCVGTKKLFLCRRDYELQTVATCDKM